MTPWSVSRCRKAAEVLVVFNTGGEHAFCGWHGFDRLGNLRWSSRVVFSATRLSNGAESG